VSDQPAEIRIVKRKKNHAGHHGGAWKVAYADFVTAMMAFFLVMWIVGMNQDVKAAVAGYFKDPIAFMEAVNAGKSPFQVKGLDSGAIAKQIAQNGGNEGDSAERKKLKEAKQTLEKIISATPEFKDLKQYIDIKLVDEGLRVDLLEAKESLFFDSASAKVKPSARHLLSQMAAELGKLPNHVIIEGHTDSRPLNRNDGYTNWELSSDRANSARKVMEGAGVRNDQMAQVRGYAATQPRDPANPTHFSNRRVSIIVVMKHALPRQQFESPISVVDSIKK
jgi:chemotaxis protein MotB